MGTPDAIRSALRIGLQAVLPLMLYGCAAISELPDSGDTDPRGPDPMTGSSYTQAVDLLLAGQVDRAETILQSRLEAEPGDDRARSLLRQIEASPTKYLGEASFEYEVRPGESLSVLAQRFLGDHRLFFILARYNEIARPSLVRAGQTIRIPSDYWDGPAPSREPLDREIRARQHLADARPREALALYEDVETDSLGRDELAVLGAAHQRWIERALSDGDAGAARARLEAARRRSPDSGHWENWLAELTKRTTAEAAYRKGLALRENEPVAAARALNRALDANPGDSRARNALSELRRNTVPALHREAVILYRNQQLDDAIRLWEQVLSIDPDFEPARGYRTRAEELRQRLKDLD